MDKSLKIRLEDIAISSLDFVSKDPQIKRIIVMDKKPKINCQNRNYLHNRLLTLKNCSGVSILLSSSFNFLREQEKGDYVIVVDEVLKYGKSLSRF